MQFEQGKTKHIHFIGIGGIGMSGMAELLYNNDFIRISKLIFLCNVLGLL